MNQSRKSVKLKSNRGTDSMQKALNLLDSGPLFLALGGLYGHIYDVVFTTNTSS